MSKAYREHMALCLRAPHHVVVASLRATSDTIRAWEDKYGKEAPAHMYHRLFACEDALKQLDGGCTSPWT